MRKLRFLRLPGTAPIDITASQNGNTSSRTVQPLLSGGPIRIVMDRSTLQIAPDSVRFSVDLSASVFRTPGPGGPSAPYDPRFHELSYFWNFGTGDKDLYKTPKHLLKDWRKADVAFGPEVAKVFTKAGEYQVEVTVLERATGLSSTTRETVRVESADFIFPKTQTHVVAHDGKFDGAPQDAIYHGDLDSAIRALSGLGATQRRLLLKRGGTYSLAGPVQVNSAMTKHLHMAAWGDETAARPVISMASTELGTNFFNLTGDAASSPRRDVRVSNIDFQGSWDPVNVTGVSSQGAFFILNNVDMVVSECSSRNLPAFLIAQGFPESIPQAFRMHLHEVSVDEFKGYPVFFGPLQGSRVALTGLRVAQNPNAYSNWPANAGVSDSGGAPVRINCSHTYIDGCDIFSHNSHGHQDLGYPQPCLRLNDRPVTGNNSMTVVEGVSLNVQRSTLEVGGQAIVVGGGDFNRLRSVTTNAVFDKLLCIGGFSTRPFIRTYNGGVTVRNCLMVLPATPYSGIALNKDFIWFQIAPADGADKTAQNAPNRVYNNTFVMLRDNAQNNNAIPGIYANAVSANNGENVAGTSPAYPDTRQDNNVLYIPNVVPPVEKDVIPLDLSLLFADLPEEERWVPRNKGRRIPSTGEMLSQFATPPDTLRYYMPIGTSKAMGPAMGDLVSHRDIRGQVRPSYPRLGAWDVNSGQ